MTGAVKVRVQKEEKSPQFFFPCWFDLGNLFQENGAPHSLDCYFRILQEGTLYTLNFKAHGTSILKSLSWKDTYRLSSASLSPAGRTACSPRGNDCPRAEPKAWPEFLVKILLYLVKILSLRVWIIGVSVGHIPKIRSHLSRKGQTFPFIITSNKRSGPLSRN